MIDEDGNADQKIHVCVQMRTYDCRHPHLFETPCPHRKIDTRLLQGLDCKVTQDHAYRCTDNGNEDGLPDDHQENANAGHSDCHEHAQLPHSFKDRHQHRIDNAKDERQHDD